MADYRGLQSTVAVVGTVSVSGDTELPAAAALADNTSNPTAPAVGAFTMVWDGANWDRTPGNQTDGLLVNLGTNNDVTVTGSLTSVGTITNVVHVDDNSGSLTVDGTVAVSSLPAIDVTLAEFPAAASITDNFANPTTTSSMSMLMVWDGSTWDRLRGDSTDGALVNLGTNNDVLATLQAGSAVVGKVGIDQTTPHTTNKVSLGSGTITTGGGVKSVLYGTTDAGSEVEIPITSEGHMEVAIHAPRLPFGSIHTESLTPVFQIDSVYGLNPRQVAYSSTGTGGVTGTSNVFHAYTGTTSGSTAVLQSRKRLRYHPGQGIIGRFASVFSTPAASSYILAGFGTAEAGYYFGYQGTTFGILHVTGGVREIQTLTVTTASTATNDYVVTLNGTAFNVTATNNGSTTKTAYEISKGTFTGWKAVQRGATVVFIADSAGNKSGSFSLAQTGAGTPAAGTFAETLAGASSTDTFIAQTDWNGDKLNGSGASGVTLNPAKGNVYQIGVQYLGFGTVSFSIEVCTVDGNNADFVTVHTIKNPNALTAVHTSQPSFPFTMTAYSTGSTTDVWVKTGSAAGFLEGETRYTGNRMTYNNTSTAVSNAGYYCLATIRNDYVYAGRANQSVVYLKSWGGAHDDTTPVILYLIRDAMLVGTPNFTQFSTNSPTYWDTAATTCTFTSNEQIIATMPLGSSGSGLFSFEDVITIQPGETVTMAAAGTAANVPIVTMTLNTREDQ